MEPPLLDELLDDSEAEDSLPAPQALRPIPSAAAATVGRTM
jgi:hypothetical protein